MPVASILRTANHLPECRVHIAFCQLFRSKGSANPTEKMCFLSRRSHVVRCWWCNYWSARCTTRDDRANGWPVLGSREKWPVLAALWLACDIDKPLHLGHVDQGENWSANE